MFPSAMLHSCFTRRAKNESKWYSRLRESSVEKVNNKCHLFPVIQEKGRVIKPWHPLTCWPERTPPFSLAYLLYFFGSPPTKPEFKSRIFEWNWIQNKIVNLHSILVVELNSFYKIILLFIISFWKIPSLTCLFFKDKGIQNTYAFSPYRLESLRLMNLNPK